MNTLKINKIKWKQIFFIIWAGQAVSLITSAVLQMALIWYLTDRTGSAMVLSLATMVGFLPQAILGTMIGVLVDRWNRKFVMIGADLIIAAAGAVLAIISISMELDVWVIMIVLFVRSLGTAFHTPALSAVTPLLVPEEHLTKCAGYSQSVQSISFILSPAIAAFLYTVWNLNVVIALDVFGALIACASMVMLKIPQPKMNTLLEKTSILAETRAGYRIIKGNKGIFSLLWIGAFFGFIFMPINALFPLMSMDYFGGTTTNASLVEIAFAVGMLMGGVILSIWGGFRKRIISIITSFFLMGSALTVSGLLSGNGFVIFVLCSAIMGFSAPLYSGIQMAVIQEKIQPEYLGRVFGLLGSIMSLTMPLGLFLSGMLADQIGINRWFFLSGICILTLALCSSFLPSLKSLDK